MTNWQFQEQESKSDIWTGLYRVTLCIQFQGIFIKARSHDPFLRIRFSLVPKIGSCERTKNDLPTHGSVRLKKRTEIEHALFSSDALLER